MEQSLIKKRNYKIVDLKNSDGNCPAELLERLNELGFVVGAEITYWGRAPFYGPLIFRLNNSLLALRKDEIQCLNLQMI